MKQFTMLILFLVSGQAMAHCRNVRECDQFNQRCHTVQVCERQYDVPAYNLAPLDPVGVMPVRPIQAPYVPPIGTTSCRLANINGVWQQVCN